MGEIGARLPRLARHAVGGAPLGIVPTTRTSIALAGRRARGRRGLALGALPGVLTLRILGLPESPRYLVTNGRRAEARACSAA